MTTLPAVLMMGSGTNCLVTLFNTSQVTTLWRYANAFIIIITIIFLTFTKYNHKVVLNFFSLLLLLLAKYSAVNNFNFHQNK